MKITIDNKELNIKPVFCSFKVFVERNKNNDEYSFSFNFIVLDKQGNYIDLSGYEKEFIERFILEKINKDYF